LDINQNALRSILPSTGLKNNNELDINQNALRSILPSYSADKGTQKPELGEFDFQDPSTKQKIRTGKQYEESLGGPTDAWNILPRMGGTLEGVFKAGFGFLAGGVSSTALGAWDVLKDIKPPPIDERTTWANMRSPREFLEDPLRAAREREEYQKGKEPLDWNKFSPTFNAVMEETIEKSVIPLGPIGELKLLQPQTKSGKAAMWFLDEYFFKRMSQWGKEYGDKNFEATGSPAWGTAAEASFNLFAYTAPLMGKKINNKIGEATPWQLGGEPLGFYIKSKTSPISGESLTGPQRKREQKWYEGARGRINLAPDARGRKRFEVPIGERSIVPRSDTSKDPLWSFDAFSKLLDKLEPKGKPMPEETKLSLWEQLKDSYRFRITDRPDFLKQPDQPSAIDIGLETLRSDPGKIRRTPEGPITEPPGPMKMQRPKAEIELEPIEVIGERTPQPKSSSDRAAEKAKDDIPEISGRKHSMPDEASRYPMPFGVWELVNGKNTRTGKPLSGRAKQRGYKKYIDNWLGEGWFEKTSGKEFGDYGVPRLIPKGIFSKNYNDSIVKQQLLREAAEIAKQRKNEQGLIDPATRPSTAKKILETLLPAIKDSVGNIFSSNITNPTHLSAYQNYKKGMGGKELTEREFAEYDWPVSKGYTNPQGKFYTEYEVSQLREISSTEKPAEIVTPGERAINDAILKDPEFLSTSKFIKEAIFSKPLDVARVIAQGAKNFKEFNLRYKQEFEGTPFNEFSKSLYEITKGEVTEARRGIIGGELESIRGLDTPTQINVNPRNIKWYTRVRETIVGKTLNRLSHLRKRYEDARYILDNIYPADPHRVRGQGTYKNESIHAAKHIKTGTAVERIDSIYEKYMGVWFTTFRVILPGKIGGNAGSRLARKYNKEPNAALTGDKSVRVSDRIQKMATELRMEMDRFFREYVMDPEMKLGDVEYIKNYLHRVYDAKAIKNNRDGFRDILVDHYLKQSKIPNPNDIQMRRSREIAEETIEKILDGKGTIPFDAVFKSADALKNEWATGQVHKNVSPLMIRSLKDIPDAVMKDYLIDNVYKRITKGIEDTISRGEYAKRFGPNNEILYSKLQGLASAMSRSGRDIKQQELQTFINLAEAIQGLLGKKIHPAFKATQMTLITGLNMSVLSWATISSMPEAILPLYHGGAKSYAKALGKELGITVPLKLLKLVKRDIKWFGKNKTRSMKIAAEIRKAGDVAAMERMNQMFAGDFTWASNAVFRINFLYYWTKFMNSLAVGTYDVVVQDYLKAKAAGKKTSLTATQERRLENLMDYHGIDVAQGINWVKAGAPLEGRFYENFKRGALMFAEDSVLTPNPAVVPLWHSQPGLAWLKHLKAFPTLMGTKVVSRMYRDVRQEFRDKDLKATGMATSGVIGTGIAMMMVAHLSNTIQDEVKFGGENPIYKDKFGDNWWVKPLRALEKTGMVSMGQFGFDAIYHSNGSPLVTLMGPLASKSNSLAAAMATGNRRSIAREFAKLTPYGNITAKGVDAMSDWYYDVFTTLGIGDPPEETRGGRKSRKQRKQGN